MTRQHMATPKTITPRLLASLVSWPLLGWLPGPVLPCMTTYVPLLAVLRIMTNGHHFRIVNWQQRSIFQIRRKSPNPNPANAEDRRPVHPVKLGA